MGDRQQRTAAKHTRDDSAWLHQIANDRDRWRRIRSKSHPAYIPGGRLFLPPVGVPAENRFSDPVSAGADPNAWSNRGQIKAKDGGERRRNGWPGPSHG